MKKPTNCTFDLKFQCLNITVILIVGKSFVNEKTPAAKWGGQAVMKLIKVVELGKA